MVQFLSKVTPVAVIISNYVDHITLNNAAWSYSDKGWQKFQERVNFKLSLSTNQIGSNLKHKQWHSKVWTSRPSDYCPQRHTVWKLGVQMQPNKL